MVSYDAFFSYFFLIMCFDMGFVISCLLILLLCVTCDVCISMFLYNVINNKGIT